VPNSAPRRSRLAEARRYQPRGRTVGDGVIGGGVVTEPAPAAPPVGPRRATAARTRLRVVPDLETDPGDDYLNEGDSETPPRRRADSGARATGPRTAGQRVVTAGGAAKSGPTPARPPRPPVPPRLGDPKRRLRLATAMALALFAFIAVRLVELQVFEAGTYAKKGLETRSATVPLPAPRGSIVDRNGEVLAESVAARYVYADPGLVKNPDATAAALSPLLGVPKSQLLALVRPHTRADGTVVRFEYLSRGVDIPTGDRIDALNLPGIVVVPDERRVVPGHDLAANLIGFTGSDLTGLGGLEASFDSLLRGVDGSRTFEIGQPDGDSNLGHEIPGGYHTEDPARPGTSLQLTIDRDLQYQVQHMLATRMSNIHATFGAAVVLDVATGEVLAQASYPSYDAADPFSSRPGDRGDVATQQPVDPGSVMKVVALSAALQTGVITPESTVEICPSIRKGDQTFSDTHPFPCGTKITIPGILAYSSNVGTITVASKLGPPTLYAFQKAYGLGAPTGEGLPGESSGLIQPPSNWSGPSYGSIPIGLGLSATPLQVAQVYATIANGGVWVQPHLVQATIAADGTRTPVAAVPSHRVISAQTAAELRTMLQAVVSVPGATGLSAAISGYSVAGKTGTGLLNINGHYQPGDVASFVGMAPADHPRYVIAVFAHSSAGNGGPVAGPAFKEMMEFTLGHYGVPPTDSKPPDFRTTE
jgi:cell division protein FtsI (penicillin-binding protein 3)